MKSEIFFRNEKTSDTWLTPPELVNSLGKFDCDPCSPIIAPWRIAPIFYTEETDGLKMPWVGRVFCNPPYGKKTKLFMKKMAEHNNGIALVFARIETQWFKEYVWKKAISILFFDKRIRFLKEDGSKSQPASAPSCLVAYGELNVISLYCCSIKGTIINLKNSVIS